LQKALSPIGVGASKVNFWRLPNITIIHAGPSYRQCLASTIIHAKGSAKHLLITCPYIRSNPHWAIPSPNSEELAGNNAHLAKDILNPWILQKVYCHELALSQQEGQDGL